MPKTVYAQLTTAGRQAARLTATTRVLLTILGRIHNDHDSARLLSALGMVSTACGLLADASGELAQAAIVERARAERE